MFTLYDLIEKIAGDGYIEVFEENSKCVLSGLAYDLQKEIGRSNYCQYGVKSITFDSNILEIYVDGSLEM
nr:MAG TPA: hypothetical protein [Caudoviricetes sp.]